MKSPSYHTFARVPSVQIPRSGFDMSFRYKTAFDSGKLVPAFQPIEILPGDSINLSVNAFARLSTPIVPFMDNLQIDFQFFFVPDRLVWDNFQKFMGEQKNPGDSIDYLVPTVTAPSGGFAVGSLADYFGIPTGVAGLEVSALPFRAYNLIFNEWYRPELLTNSVDVATDDGPDDPADYALLARYNRLDYFQGAMPSPQKGAGVELPLGGVAPVMGDGNALGMTNGTDYLSTYVSGGTLVSRTASAPVSVGSAITTAYPSGNLAVGVTADGSKSGLVADLSAATAATINSLRQAFQVQLYLEREQLGGSRYTEILRSMFGVVSPDARLQRPEYLGGGSIPIVISSVPQTSSTDSTSPQGNLAAFGLTKGKLPHVKKSFTEHGFLIGIMSCRQGTITYQQGLDRFWSRRTRFDFYWPVFAHLGEQAVLNKELYAQGPSVVDDDGNEVDDKVFGYQERFAEYRYGVSHITGKLRSTSATPLDYWHLGIKYDSLPELGDDFAKVNVPLSRVLAVQDEPQLVYDSLVSCKMYRPMPLFGQPGRIDHFF